ncbi:MAG: hypothetical protein K0Q49_970 [Haloplasmataceae bacterium]|jgi:hypothetical protein|nr:hypothetical protein [Haloplasmataceae bacterium]
MNKLKYVVLFVVISSVFTFFIIYYNNLNAFEKVGYEIKESKKTICSSCKNIVSLNDDTYYSVYSNLQLVKNSGEVIKTFDQVMSPRVLFKSSDENGVVIYYKNKEDNNYYVSNFNNKGEQSEMNGPYKNIVSDTKSIKNNFYLMTTPSDLQHVVKFDDQGKEIFNVGPFYSATILHENQDGVYIKTYDNITKKYNITNYKLNQEVNWDIESSNFYNLATFENEFVYYTFETDHKYVYKLNFDGTFIKAGPYDNKYDNNKLFKTSDDQYIIPNTINSKKVITIFDKDLNVIKNIEGYNYSNITKSLDSDDFILTNSNGSELSMVKLDQDGNEVFSKLINSPFNIKLFSSDEVIYSVKINNVELNVYLDQQGNKKWETNDIFYGTLNKVNNTYNYLAKLDTFYTYKNVDENGKEILTIGPANLINRIAYFTNGDLLYYYKSVSTDETKVLIINSKGKTILENILSSSENLPDRMIIYVGDEEIHINREFMY